ncbi:uncharacterized protein LOC121860697 [Homarus americanus]|uniref:uncharacterized protein LOC121860697 n=1 Tax=Homarus americanus TaxID=6706 RepID=UPI001C44467D|nr:uncharacterized protein LOC121860697 [Homarus americanus]
MPSASRVGVNLRASAYLHQGDRKYMEDEFQVAYQRTHDKKDIEYAFFGIFDGHGGKEAAHFAKDNLMDNIVSLRPFWSDDDEDVLAAIKEGFLQTHMAMWKVLDQWPRTASGWPSTSGTTASVAFIRREKIYIGHVGDSGIVLGCEDPNGSWRGEALTRDHKPESVVEKARITECGGKVINKSGVPRVVWNRPKSGHQGPVRRSTPMDEIPFLAVARSLGDLWSYNATNDQFVVSPEPDVCVMPIDITRHRCLIFGTDGLWNVLTPDAAVNVAHQAERNNEKHYLGVPNSCGKQRLWVNPSRSVVSGALGRYIKLNLRADNTSAVTVFLDPPGRPKREVLLQQKGMKKGSPPKPTTRLPSTEEDRNRDALVQVHMYNQSQATRHEGSRGVLRIKERLPEKWQTSQQDNQHGVQEGNRGCTDTFQDSGCGSCDNSEPGSNQTVISAETTKVGCSECGCAGVHAVPSTSGDNSSGHSSHNPTTKVLPPTTQNLPASAPFDIDSISDIVSENRPESRNKNGPENRDENRPDSRLENRPDSRLENRPDSRSENRPDSRLENKVEDVSESRPEILTENRPDNRTDGKPLRDDIQIPVVSSSTKSPGTDNKGRKHRGINGRMKSSTGTVSTEKGDSRRRTRSNIHLNLGMESENKEQNPVASNNNNEWKEEQRKEEKAGSSTKGRQALSSSTMDSSNRVLKSVNRGTTETINQNSPKTISPKRKRTSDIETESTEEPIPKSARVHTRSHTWSHKPMITRSQEKTHKTPTKLFTTPKK